MKKALECAVDFSNLVVKPGIGNKDDAGFRSGNLRWWTRHPQTSQIIPLAESAKIRCKRKFPLSRAPSNCHCHAINPLAMATGAVSAAARRL